MSQAELLALVVQTLNSLEIPCMVVGSHASSWHGEPRSTHDIDLLIDLGPDRVDALVNAFDPNRYYLSKAALIEGRMANLIDTQTGDKVDLFFAASDPQNQAALKRRQSAVIMDVRVDVASAEDTILSKLRWDRLSGGSDRQLVDVVKILIMQRGNLDRDYLESSAKVAGTYETLQQMYRQIEGDEDVAQ
jgi:hypothetical protein